MGSDMWTGNITHIYLGDTPPEAWETAGEIAIQLQTTFPCLPLLFYLMQSLGTGGDRMKIPSCLYQATWKNQASSKPLQLLVLYPTWSLWPPAGYDDPRKADGQVSPSTNQKARLLQSSLTQCPDLNLRKSRNIVPHNRLPEY